MLSPNIALPFPPEEINDWYVQQNLTDPHREAFLGLRQKRICVMGGCGQVGSHIVTQLYALGFPLEQIVINDDLRLGKTENLPEPLRDRVDLRSHRDYARQPSSHPDLVIFVGGRSSAPHFAHFRDVQEEIETWAAILGWCVAQNIRLIFASTSSLCKERPSVETQRVWPGSLYELTKLIMEDMAIQRALTDGLAVQICRFFSVYGVTEQHKGDFGNLFTQILWHAIARKPFEVWGQAGVFAPGEQTRDIIFAPEVSRALLYLLAVTEPHPRLEDISDLTYNIGLGQPMSLRAMIETIQTLLPDPLQPILMETEVPPFLKNYVVHTWGNPQKLMQAGFQPIFRDPVQNLKFIIHALTDMDGYWSSVENLRDRMAAVSGAVLKKLVKD